MVQICTLKSLEMVKSFYYITKDLRVINNNTGSTKAIWLSKRGGYPMVSLEQIGSKYPKNIPIHKIVALAFIENRDDYILIEHLDDNPLNYDPENLMFSDHSANGKRAFVNGHSNRIEHMFFISTADGGCCIGTMKEISEWLGISRGTLCDNFYNHRKGTFIRNLFKLN